MKQFLATLLFLMCFMFTGCNKQIVFVTVEFPDQPDVNLIYSVPISGTNFYGFTDTLKSSEAKIFELNLKITQPSFLVIWNEKFQTRAKFLVEPGNNYHVSIDIQNNVQITGANEKGQMLYTTLPYPILVELEIRKWLYNNDTVPFISVHSQINDLKQAEMSKFKDLLDRKEITKSYFDLIQKDRDCYFAALETRLLIIKSYESYQSRYGNNEDNLLDYFEEIYNQYPPNDESLLFSSFWSEYAGAFVEDYKQFIQGIFDRKKLEEFKNDEIYNTHIINESKKIFKGKTLEFFRARYIWFKCAEYGGFEKEFISLSEQFENDYPKSEYLKYFKPYIDKIISYHQVIEQPFDKDMLFMNTYETINTLEEAIKPLQGKKIYIDIWATWCGPCLSEFAHNEALKKILAEDDIQLLYISIDKDDKDQDWKNYIKNYHLTGIHIRTNNDLRYHLMKLFSKNAEDPSIAIPWYILIDEKGNIVEKHAKSPSQLVTGEGLL